MSSAHAYTLTRNDAQHLYSKIGYTEYDRRHQEGFSRIYMRKHLA